MSDHGWLGKPVTDPESWIGKAKIYPYFRHVGGHIPSVKFRRFPFGRRGASPLPWTCTRAEMMAGTMAETCASIAKMREKVAYSREWVHITETLLRSKVTQTNPRQGWSPFGQELIG